MARNWQVARFISDRSIIKIQEQKWSKAQATIYIDPQMDATFQKAYLEAIANWNQTGAFNFELVTEPDQADIFATEMNDGSTAVAVRRRVRQIS